MAGKKASEGDAITYLSPEGYVWKGVVIWQDIDRLLIEIAPGKTVLVPRNGTWFLEE